MGSGPWGHKESDMTEGHSTVFLSDRLLPLESDSLWNILHLIFISNSTSL